VAAFGGWYPLVGFGSLVVLSKELLVLNEELLLATNFATFVFIMWLATGETVNQLVVEKQESITKHYNDSCDLQIESIKSVVQAYETQLALIPLLNSARQQFTSLSDQVGLAQQQRAKYAAREAVAAKLNSLYQKEQAAQAAALTDYYDYLAQQVREDVANLSSEEKRRFIDRMIEAVGGAEVPDEDPVSRSFDKFLSQAQSEYQQQEQQPQRSASASA